MVRERRGRRPPVKSDGLQSIWDTPRIEKMLTEPFGAPIELTLDEARAIVREHIENPPPYDQKEADRRLRELRKIRRESGALLVRPND